MQEVRIYKCKYCGKESGRKSIRKCIMSHTKTDKEARKQIGESRKDSNITKGMI